MERVTPRRLRQLEATVLDGAVWRNLAERVARRSGQPYRVVLRELHRAAAINRAFNRDRHARCLAKRNGRTVAEVLAECERLTAPDESDPPSDEAAP